MRLGFARLAAMKHANRVIPRSVNCRDIIMQGSPEMGHLQRPCYSQFYARSSKGAKLGMLFALYSCQTSLSLQGEKRIKKAASALLLVSFLA